MATLNSDNITNTLASPAVLIEDQTGGRYIYDRVTVAATNVDNSDDNILIGYIRSNEKIQDLEFRHPDFDTDGTPLLAANIGLAYSGVGGTQARDGRTLGEVIDADCFASASITFRTPSLDWVSSRFEAATVTSADTDLEAWATAGLTSDPGGWFVVLIDVTTAAATDGSGELFLRVTVK